MKKWGFFLCIMLLPLMIVACTAPFTQQKNEEDIHEDERHGETFNSTKKITISENEIYHGYLLLVNKEYSVRSESVMSNIVRLVEHPELVNGYGLQDSSIRLPKDIARKFSTMIDAAARDGLTHFIINSGFRGKEEQNKLYHEMGASLALPAGYSEHNLGLSLDVGSTQMKMDRAPEGKWLQKNAWKYGFILRYPKDKKAITGIDYEPWHIRYVGWPHSALMHEENMTLEEYLAYLKDQKSLSTVIEGKKYHISYYPIKKPIKIQVPASQVYEISGNNMDGVIVTMTNK